MDSDDEFMSGASSREEDFEGTQDSDGDGSLGEGTNCLRFSQHVEPDVDRFR